MSKNILIIDDDPHIREVVSFALEKAGMGVAEASDGAEGLSAYEKLKSDLIVLDINMPEMDGLDVCKEIRKTSDVPILFLSSRDEEIDRIIGLEIGADDYITKPFSPRELVARVKAILKRSYPIAKAQDNEPLYQVGLLSVEPYKHKVFWDGQDVTLTATEFSILKGMIQHPERVFDRDQIMSMAYDVNINVSDRTIDSHIRHMRQKFLDLNCDALIQTVHGVGYKLTP
ncbi:MAG: two-component system response regulator CreB [Zetaproteobacteria bacterium]|nr:MAG: two-component system response regulator CreB [Zetaproteobacteria bacterium]